MGLPEASEGHDMTSHKDQRMGRRELFRRLGQAAAAAGLAALAVLLARRSLRAGAVPPCARGDGCAGCPAAGACGLLNRQDARGAKPFTNSIRMDPGRDATSRLPRRAEGD
jgi:hypothetical protein